MSKIKVYLKKPWAISDSPYYEYLIQNVSDKIEYVNKSEESYGIVKDIKKFKLLNRLKRGVKLTIRNLFPGMPNAHFTQTEKNYDLIHCAHCLSLNDSPWVMDVEYVNQFWLGGIVKKQRRKISRILEGKNCKKIIAWTNWT